MKQIHCVASVFHFEWNHTNFLEQVFLPHIFNFCFKSSHIDVQNWYTWCIDMHINFREALVQVSSLAYPFQQQHVWIHEFVHMHVINYMQFVQFFNSAECNICLAWCILPFLGVISTTISSIVRPWYLCIVTAQGNVNGNCLLFAWHDALWSTEKLTCISSMGTALDRLHQYVLFFLHFHLL